MDRHAIAAHLALPGISNPFIPNSIFPFPPIQALLSTPLQLPLHKIQSCHISISYTNMSFNRQMLGVLKRDW